MQIFRTCPYQPSAPVRGEGIHVWDRDGRGYIDLLSGLWCVVLGHSHPGFTRAIQDQLGRLVNVDSRFLTEEIEEAMAALQSTLPPELCRATFLSSGSEAVELAIKVAWASSGRTRIVGIERGYYGATARTFALSAAGRQAAYLPQDETPALLSPYCGRCPVSLSYPGCDFACLRDSVERIEARIAAEEIAAILFEPVQASGGVIVPPPGYLGELASLARRWGALLISEEVTTGMGRTGCWFGFEGEDFVPDILVLGKALGNGLPVSAIAATAAVEEACAGKLRHVQSHQNDPLSGRAASTVIAILREEGLVQRASQMGAYLLVGLQKLQASHPAIREVRGRGLMAAIELQEGLGEPGARVHGLLFEKEIILDYQPHFLNFRFFPAYVIGESDIDRALEALDDALSQEGI